MRWFSLLIAIGALAETMPTPSADPARNLARVRIIVDTDAATTDVTVDGATIASYISTVNSGPAGTGASQTGATLRVRNGTAGQTAEATFDIILADVPLSGSLTWNLVASPSGRMRLEVYSLKDLANPRLIDRFTAEGADGRFESAAALIGPDPKLTIDPVPHMVLAEFYPWYTSGTWSDPQLIDRPLDPYSTDSQSDVNRVAAEAAGAGIDAFVVSWQGKDAGGGFNDRRMRIVLDAARHVGMSACLFIETYDVNPTNDPAQPTDPTTMIAWLSDAVDLYSSHPAYLRIDNRPVIFVYAATRLQPSDWQSLLATLRATGRNPIVIGDFFQNRVLEPLDGEYQYTHVTLTAAETLDVDRSESRRVRTFNLLRANDRRRIWVASVTPGYDDSHLTGRDPHVIVDRAAGYKYDEDWTAAVGTAADWVIVTSWNEWWENTEIEPGARYGRVFLERTSRWTTIFKAPPAERPVRSR